MPNALPHENFRGINNQLVTRFKDGTYDGIECDWYDPCPICYRCMNRLQTKHDRCRECKVKTCTHSTVERNRLIRKVGI